MEDFGRRPGFLVAGRKVGAGQGGEPMISDIVALAIVERAFTGHSHLWRITDQPMPAGFYTAIVSGKTKKSQTSTSSASASLKRVLTEGLPMPLRISERCPLEKPLSSASVTATLTWWENRQFESSTE